MKKRRPSPFVAVAMVAIVAMVAAAALVLRRSGQSLSGEAPQQILAATLAAARKAGTVHIVAKGASGKVETSTMDLSPTGGTETDTIGGNNASLVAVNGTLYFQADAQYLSQDLPIPPAVAAQLANQWLAIPANADAELQQAEETLQTPVLIDNLLSLSGPITKTHPPARDEIALTGTVPHNRFTDGSGAGDTATLVISSKAPYAPISLSYSDPQNGSTVMTFSNWGEYVYLSAPAGALPLPAGVALGSGSPA